MRGLHPFVADQQNRLREIERCIGRIDRKADDLVGQHDLFIVKPGSFGAEENAELLAARNARRRFDHRFICGEDRLDLAAYSRRRREDAVEVGDSLFKARKKPGYSSR